MFHRSKEDALKIGDALKISDRLKISDALKTSDTPKTSDAPKVSARPILNNTEAIQIIIKMYPPEYMNNACLKHM